MRGRPKALGLTEVISRIVASDQFWAMVEAIDELEPDDHSKKPGRPRKHPTWAHLLVLCLAADHSVKSVRQACAHLSDPRLWRRVRQLVDCRQGAAALEPPDRWSFSRFRNRLVDHGFPDELITAFEHSSLELAEALGMLDPDKGSWDNPDPTTVAYGDGTVVTPLYGGVKGTLVTDRETGEIRQPRFDPDTTTHRVGGEGGSVVNGVKFGIVACRNDEAGERVILSVGLPGHDEGGWFASTIGRLVPLAPGLRATSYDGAVRGKHHEELLRQHGLPMLSKVHGSRSGKADKPRLLEVVDVVCSDGTVIRREVYTKNGAPVLAEFADDGTLIPVPLTRLRFERRPNTDGTWRAYGSYRTASGDRLRIRHSPNEDDAARHLNRCEHLRIYPEGTDQFDRLYHRRSDVESLNKNLKDSLWGRRARSRGAKRQLLDLMGFAVVRNARALASFEARNVPAAA